MANYEENLDAAIANAFGELSTTLPGEDGYNDATDRLTKLIKAKVEAENASTDNELRKIESELKVRDAEQAKKDKLIDHVIDGADKLLKIGVGIWIFRKGLKFEETGSFASFTFKQALGKLKFW